LILWWLCPEIQLLRDFGDSTNADNDAWSVFVKRIPIIAVVEGKGLLRLQLTPKLLQKFPLAVRLIYPTAIPGDVRATDGKVLRFTDILEVFF
jgi:hypothetical protein